MPRRRTWIPLLFLSALVTLVVQPLTQAGLPTTSDGTLHLLRTVELDSLLRQGYLFPRWAADLWLGLGYPLFNFYGPLFYYVAELFRILGAGAIGGFKIAIVLAIAGGAGSTFLLARRFVGMPGALVAATAFTLMPHLLRELFRGGDYPQLFAMMLLPSMLWSLHLLVGSHDTAARSGHSASGRPGHWSLLRILPATAAGAALLLAHNVSAMLFAPVVTIYALFLVIASGDRRTLWRLAPAAALALGFSAFFWLPALVEKSATQVDNLLTGYFDFRNHFVQPWELFAPSPALDLATMNPPMVSNVGQAQVVLAAVALLALWPGLALPRTMRAHVIVFALVAVVAGLLMLQISQPVWEALPTLALAQFPSRLLSVVGLAAALLAGVGVEIMGRRSPRLGIVYGLIAVSALVYTALPRLYPTPPFEWQQDPTVADITRYELRTGALGTSSGGEFLPREAKLRPGAGALVDAYLADKPIERLDHAPLPPGTNGTTLLHAPTLERVQFDGPNAFGALFNLIYFPGWRAYVDGLATVSKPMEPSALTLVEVPAGRHIVELRFEDTPIRTTAQVISIGSALLVLLAVAVHLRQRHTTARSADLPAGDASAMLSKTAGVSWTSNPSLERVPALVLFPGLLVLVLAMKIGFVDPQTEWFRTNSRLPAVVGLARPLQLDYANGMRLLGYDLKAQRVQPGATLKLVLYWQTTRPLARDYSVFVHLTPMNNDRQVAQADSMHPGPNPTSRWPTDKYTIDLHEMRVPPEVAPGRYRLQMGVYDSGRSVRIPLREGQAKSDPLILSEVEVTR